MRGRIISVRGSEILDSRGAPTVRATVLLEDGSVGTASVPSGASTGEYEAFELRDCDGERYGGRGVLRAVRNVNTVIAHALCGRSAFDSRELDRKLCEIDGTPNKSRLGANATLAVSLAAARAAAACCGQELYRYLGGISAYRLPIPMMNILNGGAHAANSLDIQEFMIVPLAGSSFAERLRCGAEIYRALGELLKKGGLEGGVGDEGGFAPDISSEETALELITAAIEAAGYSTASVKIALDIAAGEWEDGEAYFLPKSKKRYTADELKAKIVELCEKYPICSVEDPLGQRDWSGWSGLTAAIGDRVMLVGDDLFATSVERLEAGIKHSAANAVLVKPNQIGTLSEALDFIDLAEQACRSVIISHRSGETADSFIAELAVATGAGFIKAGAPCRGERTEKYNRLLEIEQSLCLGG